MAKNLPANAEDTVDMGSIPGLEDPLEQEMATHSNILAWKIPWTEEPGGRQSLGLQRIRHFKQLSMQPTRTYCIIKENLLDTL